MCKRVLLGLAAWVALAGLGLAQDKDIVRTIKDLKHEGKITTSPTEVTIEMAGVAEKIPINEVALVAYESEPSELRLARQEVRAGKYEDALATLEKLKEPGDREEILADVEFYRAFCLAKLALAGAGPVVDAGKAMAAFVKAHPNSYHFFDAQLLLGDLSAAMGNAAAAQKFYGKVATAPWPDYKMRASVALGYAYLSAGDFDKAQAEFDVVIKQRAEGPQSDAQRQAAIFGKARCLAEAGKAETAVKVVEGEIEKLAEKEEPDVTTLARAYLTLGIVYDKLGKPKEAMFALLRVDTLYAADREAHAEALFHLVRVFNQLRKPERAKEAQATLQNQYGESRWARADKPAGQ